MKRKFSRGVIDRLKEIKDDLLRFDVSPKCPRWTNKATTSCKICKKLFPKIEPGGLNCPCHIYSSKYLIKRLNEIIRANEEG